MTLLPPLGPPGWFEDRNIESEEGWSTHCCLGRTLAFIFQRPTWCLAQGGGAGVGSSTHGAGSCSPARLPRALWQGVGIRCSSLAAQRAFPAGIKLSSKARAPGAVRGM